MIIDKGAAIDNPRIRCEFDGFVNEIVVELMIKLADTSSIVKLLLVEFMISVTVGSALGVVDVKSVEESAKTKETCLLILDLPVVPRLH